MPNYKSIADLKGKKIGVTAPGSSTNIVANFVLAKGGLKPSDVSFIGVGTAAGAISAMRSGQIDAISNLDPVVTMLEEKKDIKVIADTRTLKDTNDLFGGPMPAASLYTTDAFLKKNPNTAQALTNAMVRALKWLQTAGPSDIIKVVPESYQLGDRALLPGDLHQGARSLCRRTAVSPRPVRRLRSRPCRRSSPSWQARAST